MNNVDIFIAIIKYLAVAVIAGGLGYYIRRTIAEAKIISAEHEAERLITQAQQDAEAKSVKRYWKRKKKFISFVVNKSAIIGNAALNYNNLNAD